MDLFSCILTSSGMPSRPRFCHGEHWLVGSASQKNARRVVVAAALCELLPRRDDRVLLARSLRQRREPPAPPMQPEDGCGVERGKRPRRHRGG